MKGNRLVLAVLAALAVVGCEGGGVDIGVETVDNSVDNSTNGGGSGGGNNPCASYTPPNSNEVRIGTFDGTNCSYPASFVGKTNPLLVDLTIPFISGVHIFQDSLFVGQDVASGAPAGGEGPTLTIAAGNRLAFSNTADYVLINRGSQIIANGSAAAPITFTAFADAVSNTAGANDVSLWGGIVINGNGITNNCNDAERDADLCHVVSEGQPSNYGGNNNADNSGVLRFVVIKHTGFEVAPDSELNGITFNAVGSGTTVENVQVYSTFDDGLEFFGGAVNLSKVVVLYARDDSLDFSDGYIGGISEALLIHFETDGNHCIEGDNVASGRISDGEPADTPPISAPTFRNLTCITSNGGGTHGDSRGFLARLGAQIDIADSIVFSGYGTRHSQGALTGLRGVALDSSVTRDFAATGVSTFMGSLVASEEPTFEPDGGAFANGDPLQDWVRGLPSSTNGANYSFNTGNAIIAAPDATNDLVSVLEENSFYTVSVVDESVLEENSFYTVSVVDEDTGTWTFADEGGNPVTVTPVSTDTCDDCPKVGAVLASSDWTAPWAFGLREQNADAPLWFIEEPAP